MAKLRAVILAAGRGTRMGGKEVKALTPVDGKEPLLHYTLNGLRHAGVEDVLVVTGFKPDALTEYVTEQWGENSSFVFNARYASWGNFHTVRMALEQSPGFDVLVVNSDVIVHPTAVKRVVDTDGDMVLAVEKRLRLDDEDMKVRLTGRLVTDIGKGIKTRLAQGEYTGVSLLRPDAARAYLDAATEVEWHGDTNIYYEDVYKMILDKVDTRAARVEEGEYAEVDEPSDLQAAAQVLARHPDAWRAPANT